MCYGHEDEPFLKAPKCGNVVRERRECPSAGLSLFPAVTCSYKSVLLF